MYIDFIDVGVGAPGENVLHLPGSNRKQQHRYQAVCDVLYVTIVYVIIMLGHFLSYKYTASGRME